MNRILIGFIFLIASTTGISQETQPKKKKVGFRKWLNALTLQQINQLKEGALLVRLKTKKLTIAELRKAGNNSMADEMEKKQAEFNLNIIAAFNAHFDFCPTYFFLSDYSIYIKKRKFDQVIFLNDSLHLDTAIHFKNKPFLVAEFGIVEQDTAKYISHYSFEANYDWSIKQVPNYYGGPYFGGYEALIISSDQFVQLRDPFPYFVRTRSQMPKKSIVNKSVWKLNKKLTRFYRRKNMPQLE